jgi:hypothetical protein
MRSPEFLSSTNRSSKHVEFSKGAYMNDNRFPSEEDVYSSFFQGKLQDEMPKKKPFWKRHFLKIYAVVTTMLVLLLGYSTVKLAMEALPPGPSHIQSRSTPTAPAPQPGVTPAPSMTPTPSATAIPPAGTIICQADWSQGVDGWSSTPDWKYVSQMLVNDGTTGGYDYSIILAPCRLSSGNYVVEAQIQYTRGEDEFGLLARGDGGGATGYMGLVSTDRYDNSASIYRNTTSLAAKEEYKVDTAWHIYRLEVRNEHLLFFIDGQQIVETTDTTYLSAGRAGLVVRGDTQINVKSFQITAL